MDKYNIEKILSIHHWSKDLFSFKCTRNPSFKFNNGEFTLVGLLFNNLPITRAYSIVSSNYENFLEFFSIKILNGALTSKLKNLKIGDNIIVGKKASGTLLVNNLLNGKILWLISTGTGLAPFISLIKNFSIYNNFDKIILIHTSKYKNGLSYRYYLTNVLFRKKFFLGLRKNFFYYPSLTKENFFNIGRITYLLKNYKIFNDLNFSFFSKDRDRIMLCGSIKMLKDLINILNILDFKEGKNNLLGHYVIERAFVD